MIFDIHHTSFTVGDMERSIDFYCDLLGCKLVWDSKQAGIEFKGETANNVTNCPGTEQRVVFLSIGKGLIELVQYIPGGKEQIENRASDTGICHLCFKTRDIEGFYNKLVANGVKTHCEPQVFGSKPDKLFYFRDPDGTILEAIEGNDVLGIS